MANFLSLPRELRDLIYLLSTRSHWDVSSPSRVAPKWPGPNDTSFWPENNGKWQWIRLLSVNKQVRQEVLDLINDRHKDVTGPLRAAVDLRLRGYAFTPRWSYLDYRLQRQDHLNLDVNLTITTTDAFEHDANSVRDPDNIFRSMLNLLCRFIYNGPGCLEFTPSFETPGPHFIDILSVHVCFEDDYTPATWADTTHEIFRMLKALALLDTAHHHIGKIRASTAYTYRGHNTIRKSEWDVCSPDSATVTEVELTRMRIYFGSSWLSRNLIKG